MCVPSASAGGPEIAATSSRWEVVKSTSTVSSGPNRTTATGSFWFRWPRKARAARIAPAIGPPRMLLDASIRRTAPAVDPGAATSRFETAAPFSVTTSLLAVTARFSGSSRM